MEQINRIKIDNVDVFLENLGPNMGKITISDTYNHNYSYSWGSMGGTLEKFLCSIDAGYFADKLMGYKTNYSIDVKKTFREVRKYIKNEIGLSWFEHLEFQKDMRERLNDFQVACEENDSRYFIDHFFNSFIDRLEYWNIEAGRFDRERIEKYFKGISEHWYFIIEKPNKEYLWLVNFHKRLTKAIKNIQNCTIKKAS